MAKPRVTATDRLSNVIEVVELGQRTGMLSVERGSGSVREDGEIYFVAGRAVYASLAGLRGREALAALGRWGPCRFAFDAEAPHPAPNLTASAPGVARQHEHPAMAAPAASNFPLGQASRIPEGSGTWRIASGPVDGRGYSYPGQFDAAGANSPPFSRSGVTSFPDAAGSSRPSPAPPQTTAFLARRPRRAPDVRDLMAVVSSHQLSRSHRTVLLLADGEHTVLDLARLSSKQVDEVSVLLGELESRGLIYYYD